MRNFCICFALFLALGFCRSEKIQHRIIGGQVTSISELPYQLSVGRFISDKEASFLCGGALVSEQHGLSAAHCFAKAGTYYVRAGSDKLNTDTVNEQSWYRAATSVPKTKHKENGLVFLSRGGDWSVCYFMNGGQVVKLRYVLIHPNYASNQQQDCDIAVLNFFEPLKLSKTIKPIQMADANDEISPGSVGTVSGWGQTSSNVQDVSTKLKSVELPVTDQEICRISYRTILQISDRQFCAGAPSGGKDSCQGDSGGPFAINNKLYGLVSFGISCAQPGMPGVYVRIPAHRDYIRANTGL